MNKKLIVCTRNLIMSCIEATAMSVHALSWYGRMPGSLSEAITLQMWCCRFLSVLASVFRTCLNLYLYS